MKAKPKPTTHHRSHQKTSSVPLARTGYGPKTGRSQCLLGDKFRHQYPPDYPGKEGSALLTPVCAGDFMVHKLPESFRTPKGHPTSNFRITNLFGPVVEQRFLSDISFLFARAERKLVETAHSTLLSWATSILCYVPYHNKLLEA